MSAPLIFPCISSLNARDFTTGLGSFYLPTGITHVPFYLTFTEVCQHISPSDVPATVTFFPTGVPDAVPVVCDPLTYDELQSTGEYVYVQCPLNTDTINSGSSYTLSITGPPSYYGQQPTTSFLNTVFTYPPDQACAMSTSTNLPYLATLGQNLSPSDGGYLALYVDYNPLQCQEQDGGVVPVKIVAPDGQVYTTTFATQTDLSTYSPTSSYTQTLSTRDFGLPTNGQLMDGTYTISSLGDSSGTFTVSHIVTPSGMALRRRLESRWNEFVNQPQQQQQQGDAAQPQAVDSSFFFKANNAACSHTQCPVPGQVGVFECVNTQTDLDSCGGCPTQGGRACGDIAGASEVACVAGKCVVSSCDAGFMLKNDKSECIAAKTK